MIRANAVKLKNGIVRVSFTSNNPEQDRDEMDLIGEALVGQYPRRGGYSMESGAMEIDVKTGEL